jgi:hypothetical protein
VNQMAQRSPSEPLLAAPGIQHRVPRRTLSAHPALQGLATSHYWSSALLSSEQPVLRATPRIPKVISDYSSAERHSPAALRPVRGFPALRLLWRLRRPDMASVDCTPSHPYQSLPRSQRWTRRSRLGGDLLSTQSPLWGIPNGDGVVQVARHNQIHLPLATRTRCPYSGFVRCPVRQGLEAGVKFPVGRLASFGLTMRLLSQAEHLGGLPRASLSLSGPALSRLDCIL